MVVRVAGVGVSGTPPTSSVDVAASAREVPTALALAVVDDVAVPAVAAASAAFAVGIAAVVVAVAAGVVDAASLGMMSMAVVALPVLSAMAVLPVVLAGVAGIDAVEPPPPPPQAVTLTSSKALKITWNGRATRVDEGMVQSTNRAETAARVCTASLFRFGLGSADLTGGRRKLALRPPVGV